MVYQPITTPRGEMCKFGKGVSVLCLQSDWFSRLTSESIYIYVGEWGGELREAGWKHGWSHKSEVAIT